VTIFYCLRFETSLFVASCDSQSHGGGIRPRLHTGLACRVESSLMLRPTVSRPVFLGIKHPSGAYDQIFITCVTVAVFFLWGAFSDERSGLFLYCCWPLPAQSFSGPSPLGRENIFYCLRFETSFFVTSCDSQGCGGGIRPRLHTGLACLANSSCFITFGRPVIEHLVQAFSFSCSL
jgi:hypothetical protein